MTGRKEVIDFGCVSKVGQTKVPEPLVGKRKEQRLSQAPGSVMLPLLSWEGNLG